MGKVQITDFTDEKLGFIGALIYKAAAEWFAENESAEQRENGFEQQTAGRCITGIIYTVSTRKAMFVRMTGCAGGR